MVPFLALPLAVRAIVPRVGDSLARAFMVVAPPGGSRPALPFDAGGPPQLDDDDGNADDGALSPSAPAVVRRPKLSADAGARDGGARGRGSLFIPASVTARALPLAEKSARASSVVLADGTRGVELRGVRALRAGLEEGDVLVALEGQSTPTPEVALSVITAALAAHATPLHGALLRHGRPIDVTVEVPQP